MQFTTPPRSAPGMGVAATEFRRHGGGAMEPGDARILFNHAIDAAGLAISLAGVAVIAGGILLATWRVLGRPQRGDADRYVRYRREVGQAILLGLEFLVAADIIETVAVAPTAQNVVVLGGIVLIRTFLSIALQVELEGRWPWHSARADARERA
jgi:uncharacterized membrane protein